MNQTFSLGLDFGTSGARCVVLDPAAQVVASSVIAGTTHHKKSGRHEQQPEVWWQQLLALLQQLPAEVRANIGRIAVDGTSGSILLCKQDGTPLSACLMYNDLRAAAEARHVRDFAPGNSGAHGAGASLAKAIWLQKKGPRKKKQWLLHQADWLANRLCGRFGVCDYNNALKLGYDPQSLQWPEWLKRSGLPDGWFPEVVEPGQLIGEIGAEIAMQTGLPQGAAVCSGTTDSIAAFIATGIRDTRSGMTSLGSTLVLKQLCHNAVFAPQYGVYSHRLGSHWLVGGASNCGGATLREFFSIEEIAELSRGIDPATDSGVIYYPLHGRGERFPLNDPELEARLTPDCSHDPQHFLHALLEGLARVEKFAWERLEALGADPIDTVISTGGAAGNPVLTQLRQRILNKTVLTAPHSDAAYGAALLALRGLPQAPL